MAENESIVKPAIFSRNSCISRSFLSLDTKLFVRNTVKSTSLPSSCDRTVATKDPPDIEKFLCD